MGGFLATVAAAWGLAALLSRFEWCVQGLCIGCVYLGALKQTSNLYCSSQYRMTCPRTDLTVWGKLTCPPNPIFSVQRYILGDVVHHMPSPIESLIHAIAAMLPDWLRLRIIDTTFSAMPMQVHAVMLGMMASFAAPFGGFFASGFKRAFKIKDFGDSIPGHGGMTDRMDCQVCYGLDDSLTI